MDWIKKFETLQNFEENQRIGSFTRNSSCEFDGQILIIENNIIAIEKDICRNKNKIPRLIVMVSFDLCVEKFQKRHGVVLTS